MARKPGVPSSREDASRPGRAIVTLTDSRTRKRRTFRLGTFGGAESRERYARARPGGKLMSRRACRGCGRRIATSERVGA